MISVGYDRISFFQKQNTYRSVDNWNVVDGNQNTKVYKFNSSEEFLDFDLKYARKPKSYSGGSVCNLDLNVARSINSMNSQNYGNLCLDQSKENIINVLENINSAIESEVSFDKFTLRSIEMAFDLYLDKPFSFYIPLFARAFSRNKRSFIKDSTLYFGGNRSLISYKIYDKSRELKEVQGLHEIIDNIIRVEATIQYKAIIERFGTKKGYIQLSEKYDDVVKYLQNRYLQELVHKIRKSEYFSRSEKAGSLDFSIFGKDSTTAENYFHMTKSILNDYGSIDLYWEDVKQRAIKNGGERQYKYKLSDYRKYQPFIMHFIMSGSQVPLYELVDEIEYKLNQANLPNQLLTGVKSDFRQGKSV